MKILVISSLVISVIYTTDFLKPRGIESLRNKILKVSSLGFPATKCFSCTKTETYVVSYCTYTLINFLLHNDIFIIFYLIYIFKIIGFNLLC